MRLLIDTHVFLWAVTGNRQLKASTRKTPADAEVVFVSAALLWEIVIKVGIGKLEGDPMQLAAAIEASGFRELPVTARHAAAVAGLPMHRTDPFDRLLPAQAFMEPLRLVIADRALSAYGGAVEVI